MLGRDGHPASLPRRSALHEWHQAHGAVFKPVAGQQMVACYDQGDREPDALATLGLVDLSLWPRRGYRGPGVEHWLSPRLPLPKGVNQARQTERGDWVLRTGAVEYWWLSSLAGATAEQLPEEPAERPADGVYDLHIADSHALIALSGERAPACLAGPCALDLRPDRFGPACLAQTQVAGINVQILRLHALAAPVFLLFCESSLALYLWESLLLAGRDLGATAAGTAALETRLARAQSDADGGS
ncbi:MAG: hypothetical protein ACO3KY_01540 [Lysobacterales bacterium]